MTEAERLADRAVYMRVRAAILDAYVPKPGPAIREYRMTCAAADFDRVFPPVEPAA